jgi:hypothetical protein
VIFLSLLEAFACFKHRLFHFFFYLSELFPDNLAPLFVVFRLFIYQRQHSVIIIAFRVDHFRQDTDYLALFSVGLIHYYNYISWLNEETNFRINLV